MSEKCQIVKSKAAACVGLSCHATGHGQGLGGERDSERVGRLRAWCPIAMVGNEDFIGLSSVNINCLMAKGGGDQSCSMALLFGHLLKWEADWREERPKRVFSRRCREDEPKKDPSRPQLMRVREIFEFFRRVSFTFANGLVI